MPLRDYRCDNGHMHLDILDHGAPVPFVCSICGTLCTNLISAPASIRMADMPTLNRKRQRIKEPIWRYPDGSFEPINP